MAVMTVDADALVVVKERLEVFAGEVLAEAMNRPVQRVNGSCICGGSCDTMRLRMKPPTRTCTALAVTAVESAGSAEAQQSAPLTFGTFDHTLRTDPVRPSGFMRQPPR